MGSRSRSRSRPAVFLITALVVLFGTATLGLRGRGVRGLVMAVLRSSSVTSDGDFTNVIFLHQSTGRNLIEQGGVRELFAEEGYDFWDHDYNGIGIRRPNGTYAGFHYRVPGDNTDPDGLARIFTQPAYNLPINTFSGLLQHEVIAFKSCFPANHITSDEQLEGYRQYYLTIRDVMDKHPDRVFIVVTPPPLNPVATNAEAASRARAFADWLVSDEYLSHHPNVFTFDLFGLRSEGNPAAQDYGMLREDYRTSSGSYPNRKANETIGPLFVDFIVEAATAYREMDRGTDR